MNTIYLYDIAEGKWYTQTASGDTPASRRRFCAGVTWAQDQSSYNIYLYGGAGFGENATGFDDVYILTMPSFVWIKWYPTQPGQGVPHNSLSCDVIDGAQMLIIGGTFPNSSQVSCTILTMPAVFTRTADMPHNSVTRPMYGGLTILTLERTILKVQNGTFSIQT